MLYIWKKPSRLVKKEICPAYWDFYNVKNKGKKMKETIVKTKKSTKIPLKVYVENFLRKYKELTSCDLTILISHSSKSTLTFDRLQASIATTLNIIKKEGKVSKIGQKKWKWSDESYG